MMFKKNERQKMENYKLFYYFHDHGFAPERVKNVKGFKENIEVLSTSRTKKGRQFISMFRHRKFPWFATQFHPEKIIYEHEEKLNILKTNDNFKISRKFSDYFYQMVKGRSSRSHFLDNRSVQLMKMDFTVNYDHKNVDEVIEWNYFAYYRQMATLI